MQHWSSLLNFKSLLSHNVLVRFKSCAATNFKLNILFFGTDTFSLRSLISLENSTKSNKSKINRIDVVTSFRSKGNPVKKYADDHGMVCMDWATLKSNTNIIKHDLGVVVSFGHLIPENIINTFPYGMINVHGSLLPRWRGASPIIYSILNEDSVTGVSIMRISPNKFDVGEILAAKSVEIPKNVLMPHLHKTLSNEGATLLTECIENAPASFQNGKQQDDNKATYAPKVPESMATINWQMMTAKYVCNLYRALYSFKWLTTCWQKRRVKIRDLDLTNDGVNESNLDRSPGYVEYDKINKCLCVHCSDGHFISIKKLSVEGKPVMTAADFNNGFLKKVDPKQRYFT
ncbi:methionyl-tRNA formyltransferase, mitochondrial [Contarinia nasturtii]|uniref:methionyl-tRNA formyltransferase, mitochondrial n=1 Tax=Contarinia nasturtii TaxID=265458 RepID=UPI0012D48B19|nr:methionyl-tRNA formyltransferase, mitochondrial [Contarinia nasturtii]